MTDKTTKTDTLEHALDRLPSSITAGGRTDRYDLHIAKTDVGWLLCYEGAFVIDDKLYIEGGQDLHRLADEMYKTLNEGGWL